MEAKLIRQTVATVLISVFFSTLCSALWLNKKNGRDNKSKATIYENVLERREIRCGYVPYPPGCIKDPGSAKMSGIFVETIEKAANNMGLQVVWAEEVGWGTMIEGLKTNRYDMIASPVWANSTRGKLVDFTVPLFYSGICAYVRSGESKFVNISSLSSPDVKIATIDGEMTSIIASDQFPKAKIISHPEMADVSQLLEDVVTRKADVTFVEPYIANKYLKAHPGSLKNISPENPLRIFANSMMVNKGEGEFLSMLNTAIMELINSGSVEKSIQQYAPLGSFYSVALPYRSK